MAPGALGVEITVFMGKPSFDRFGYLHHNIRRRKVNYRRL